MPNSYLIRSCLTCICVFLSSFPDALASVDICQDPTTYSRLSIGFGKHGKSSFDGSPGETNQENQYFDLTVKTANNKFRFGAGHRYTIFDINGLAPETNGHLHTFFLAFHRQTETDHKTFRVSVAPALSASSNVIDNSDEITTDAVQVLGALVWGTRLSDRSRLQYGLCADHRFGTYKIYPVISFQMQPHPDWDVQLGFPNSQLSYQITERSGSRIRVFPDGNEWYVLDKALARHSRFVYESYALEWAFDWQAHQNLVITASVGRQVHQRYEMTLQDESRVRLSSEPETRIGAALEWRF